jgi:hypothetical protein
MNTRGLEDTLNRLADIDAGWWPFLRLRPERSQPMDNRWLLRMALHYGTLYGALIFIGYWIVGFLPPSPLWAAACVLAFIAYFFLAYKFTFAIFWNRRAARLRAAAEGLPQSDEGAA